MITPCILVYCYFEAKLLALKPTTETNTDAVEVEVVPPTKKFMSLPQEQEEINELDPDCQCRHVVPKGLTLFLE